MEDQVFNAPVFARMIAREVAQMLEQSIGDEVMTVNEAAKFLQLSATTIRAQLIAGHMPGCRIGGQWRLRRSALLHHVSPSPLVREITHG